jgi:hypothetical protein
MTKNTNALCSTIDLSCRSDFDIDLYYETELNHQHDKLYSSLIKNLRKFRADLPHSNAEFYILH